MTPHVTQPESCRKHGVILTCFVDGRKRFRAVPVHPGDPEAIGGLDEQAGEIELSGLLTAIKRPSPSQGD
ncbi:hypothetical protein RAS2_31110 [Phycisphaerae bacterium RAS2]|nr:hypothetical protein RAS2_31110 [Phycisphaerae bacterium RAS2]